MKQKTTEILIEVEEIICLRKPAKKSSAVLIKTVTETKNPAAKICPHCRREISETDPADIEICPG